MDNKKINRIANQARNSIGNYCINECKSFCCRNGYLVIRENSINLVTQGKKDEFIKKGNLKPLKDGKYSLLLGDHKEPCPSLDIKTFCCKIHKSKLRPKPCREFPMFIEEDIIKLSPRCPAIRENKLYPYIKKLMKLGLKPKEYEQIPELDLYSVKFR
jgi:Fe-S-cluster containining protein